MRYHIIDHSISSVDDTDKVEEEINKYAKDGYCIKTSAVYNLQICDGRKPYAFIIMGRL